jgi:hypothetical protein
MISSFSTFQSLVNFTPSNAVVVNTVIPNKVMFYTFENTSGNTIINEWPLALNATASTSTVVSTVSSRFGLRSAYFNGISTGSGSSYGVVSVPYNSFRSNITANNGLSISMWLRRTGNISGETHIFRTVATNTYPTDGGCALYYNGSTQRYGWGSVWSNGNLFSIPNDLNNWHHLVLIADINNRITVYLNGVLVKNLNNSDLSNITHPSPSVIPLHASIGDFFIGGPNPGAGWGTNYFGFIDHFKVYNKVLTATEVSYLFNNTDT